VFGYLAYLHVHSAYITVTIDSGKDQFSYLRFEGDREGSTCDRAARSDLEDPAKVLGRVCVGETATRGLLFVLGIATAALETLLEGGRRTGRLLVTSWKVRARTECELEDIDDDM
jgi:hypothetical protein